MAMNKQLVVHASKVRAKAGDFKTATNNTYKNINEVKTQLETLSKKWQGNASLEFQRKFNSFTNSFNTMFKVAEEYSTDMETVSTAYEKTESSNVSRTGQVQTPNFNK